MSSVQDMVFAAAKAGDCENIRELLGNLDQAEIQIVLGTKKHVNGETTTPLLVAALYANLEVIDLLITEYNTNVEQTGMVEYDGHLLNSKTGNKYYVSHHAYHYRRRHLLDDGDDDDDKSDLYVNGATALHLAVLKCYFNAVETLVLKHHANVNTQAMDGSTALRVACVNGDTAIVRFLIEHGADVNATMKDKSTCLMIAALHKNRQEVKLMVKNGADVNAKTEPQGRTALHYAAQGGDYIIVINLMRNGAEFCEDLQGFTPIHIACMVKDSDILEYLLSNFNCTTKERIEATELLGAAFISSDPSMVDVQSCFQHWQSAMEDRYDDMENIIHKRMLTSPSAIYQKEQEVQSLEELFAIKDKKEEIIFEAIMAQERILGENTMLHPDEIAKFLTERGNTFAQNQDYKNCVVFWLKSIAIRKQADQCVSEDVIKFVQLLEDMDERQQKVETKMLWNILEICIEDIQNQYYRLTHSENYGQIKRAQKHVDNDIHFMLFIWLKLRTLTEKNEEDSVQLKKYVTRFNNLQVLGSEGSTILHTCCDDKTRNNIENHYLRHAMTFPNIKLVEMLLEFGTDATATNYQNESALHTIGLTEDFDEAPRDDMMRIARLLIDHGAPMDERNLNGMTPQDSANVTIAYYLKQLRAELPLKCLAAQIVKQFVPNYEQVLPKSLATFVHSH